MYLPAPDHLPKWLQRRETWFTRPARWFLKQIARGRPKMPHPQSKQYLLRDKYGIFYHGFGPKDYDKQRFSRGAITPVSLASKTTQASRSSQLKRTLAGRKKLQQYLYLRKHAYF